MGGFFQFQENPETENFHGKDEGKRNIG